MAKVDVYNLDRKKVGTIDLADEVFGVAVNEHLFYEVVKAQLASRRSGTAYTKERSFVVGSTRKISKQKGGGRARHGSIRASTFVGGGTAHGPRPRSYAYRPPRKVRKGALCAALSLRLKEGKLVVVDHFDLPDFKTKDVVAALARLGVEKALLVDARENEKLAVSSRNLPGHNFLPPEGVNVYDILRHREIVLTQLAAKALEARCLETRGRVQERIGSQDASREGGEHASA